jgi:hypothetical protein
MANRTSDLRRSPSAGRPPALVVRLELEQPAKVVIDADSFEDEQRLRFWLRRNRTARRLLDELGVAA